MANDLRQLIKDLNRLDDWYVVTRGVNHPKVYKLVPTDSGTTRRVLVTTLPSTPSDHRSFANSIANLRAWGYIHKGR